MKTSAFLLIASALAAAPAFAQVPSTPMPPPAGPPPAPPASGPAGAYPPPSAAAYNTLTAGGTVPAGCPNGSHTLYCTPEVYSSGDVLIFAARTPTGPLLVNRYTGETTADFRDQFGTRWAAGPAVTLGRQVDRCLSAEVGYLGLYHFGTEGNTFAGRARPTSADPNAAGQLIAAETVPFRNGATQLVLRPGDTQRYNGQMDLNSVEFNLRNDVAERLAVYVGVRYVSLTDRLSAELAGPNENSPSTGGYNVETRNNLFGVQVGAQYTSALLDPLYLRAYGKAGLYGNAATQSTAGTFADATNRFAVATSDSHGQVAFFGQAGVNLVYEITPRIHVRGGYNVILASGVATAPGQLNNGGGIASKDTAVFHGMNFGLEYHR